MIIIGDYFFTLKIFENFSPIYINILVDFLPFFIIHGGYISLIFIYQSIILQPSSLNIFACEGV